jgi:hypothetical protein
LSAPERREPPDLVAELIDAIIVPVADQQEAPSGRLVELGRATLELGAEGLVVVAHLRRS